MTLRNKHMAAGSTVAARRVRALLDFAATRGAREATLMRRASVDAAELEDPDNRLPLTKYIALMRAAEDACNDPAFALHFGESVDLEKISMIGMVSGGDTLGGGG